MRQTFGKDERLHKKILINKLFAEGTSLYVYPFRVTTLQTEDPSSAPVQILISVPKHSFHKAVDRNLLKRRIREGYRKNKEALIKALQEGNRNVLICFTYTAKTILPYSTIQDKIIILIKRLMEGNEKTSG
jgi:ribonuclease P protein component